MSFIVIFSNIFFYTIGFDRSKVRLLYVSCFQTMETKLTFRISFWFKFYEISGGKCDILILRIG